MIDFPSEPLPQEGALQVNCTKVGDDLSFGFCSEIDIYDKCMEKIMNYRNAICHEQDQFYKHWKHKITQQPSSPATINYISYKINSMRSQMNNWPYVTKCSKDADNFMLNTLNNYNAHPIYKNCSELFESTYAKYTQELVRAIDDKQYSLRALEDYIEEHGVNIQTDLYKLYEANNQDNLGALKMATYIATPFFMAMQTCILCLILKVLRNRPLHYVIIREE